MAVEKNIPEIRFNGFEGEWEESELGKIVKITMGQSPLGIYYTNNPDDHILVQGNADMKNGNVVPRVWTKQVTKTADANDLIMSVRAPVGEIGKTAFNIVIGRGVAAIKGNEFIFQSLKRMNEIGFWKQFSAGSTFDSINSNDLFNSIISITTEPEQTQIGTYFQNLDSLISLHQRKYDKLLTVKKAMLEKMFPKEGADVPEIRFKGFEGKWEKKTLEQSSSKIGDGLHGTPQYVDNGGVFFINGNNLISGEVVINSETKQVSVYEQSKNDKSLDENTILMSINGTIGNLAYYKNEKIMLGKSVAYITLNNINKTFLYGYLQTEYIQNHFTNNLTGSTIKNLGLKTIRETEILLPEIDEQTKIGTFFQNLDIQISQHQKQLEKLKNVKKACLEKMFV